MGHIPHIYLPPPWPAGVIPLPDATRHHLKKVLRSADGDQVSYTDGAGAVGAGALGLGGVARGDERTIPRPAPGLVVAVAPPQRSERARIVVEKLAELGVDRLLWLDTVKGSRHLPRAEKMLAWAVGALEQSRGAHILDVAPNAISLAELRSVSDQPLWVAEPGEKLLPSVLNRGDATVAIGPEAGFTREEIPSDSHRFGLGGRILRVETAAIAATVLVLARNGRLDG